MKTILVDAVDTFVLKGVGVYQPLKDLLDQYKNPKIILTNANDEQIVEFGLTNLPYELFTLKHNPDKTNPTYFNQMLEHFKLKSEDTLYFEHNMEAVKSAQSVGIVSHYYDPDKKNLADLKDFIDKNI